MQLQRKVIKDKENERKDKHKRLKRPRQGWQNMDKYSLYEVAKEFWVKKVK